MTLYLLAPEVVPHPEAPQRSLAHSLSKQTFVNRAAATFDILIQQAEAAALPTGYESRLEEALSSSIF
jgi:hypothetical protein